MKYVVRTARFDVRKLNNIENGEVFACIYIFHKLNTLESSVYLCFMFM